VELEPNAAGGKSKLSAYRAFKLDGLGGNLKRKPATQTVKDTAKVCLIRVKAPANHRAQQSPAKPGLVETLIQ
jgi:hypothetical protein